MDANSGVTSGWPSDGGVHIDNYSTRYRYGSTIMIFFAKKNAHKCENAKIGAWYGKKTACFCIDFFSHFLKMVTVKIERLNFVREGLDLVLKGINARVRPGEKIGIVGRTGAGYSHFTSWLFNSR